jgi:hypothetical protein
MLKVIIAGGRDFTSFPILEDCVNNCLSNQNEVVIVSGNARGADILGEKYAYIHKHTIDSHPANWDKFGKSAGYKRNEEMAKVADALIAFWDGKSKGTKHMIDLAKKYNLKIRVFDYEGRRVAL